MEQNDKGKIMPVKIGLAPVQRESVEYEFDIVMNIDQYHTAFISKDTTFLDGWTGIITPELGKSLKEWLDEGVEPEICYDCKRKIYPEHGRTIQQIAEGTLKNYGRKLCWWCMAKEIQNQKNLERQKGNSDE